VIDFRYHLVSLASVLIALAVGIVLGAGPLKEDIGNTLTTEVTKLREEKASLRSQLDEADSGNQVQDDYATAVLPEVVADRLAGRSVAVVALPGSSSDVVDRTKNTLESAGALVVGDVTVTDSWVSEDPDTQQERQDLGSTLVADLGLESPDVPGSQDVDVVLGSVLLSRGEPTNVSGDRTDESRLQAWNQLKDANLVDGSVGQDGRANAAVLVGGSVGGSDAEQADRAASSLVALSRVLDASGFGAVLASNTALDPSDGTSVVATARSREGDGGVSTVDDLGSGMGQASTVFALLGQYDNQTGHYALGPDATAPFPEIPAT
jgi:hypothetical protein